MIRILVPFLLLFASLCSLSYADDHRCLWVTRWDYQSPRDIHRIMDNAKKLGANEVLFQIRGHGTVFYPSSIEPWSGEFTDEPHRHVGKNPGWDPLKTAIQEARKHNLNIHAWMNVFPGWRGKYAPPKSSQQLWNTHRSWFIVDHRGSLLYPRTNSYSFLSPGIPAVRKYLASVFGEVAQKYPDLTGIHMDYVRYPVRSEYGRFRDFSHDKTSIKLYKNKYKKEPHYSHPEWHAFKQDNVTATIKGIRHAIQDASPTMQLSGTFMAEIHRATEEAGQNPVAWIENNLVDWVVPMVYKRSPIQFRETINELQHFLKPEWSNKIVWGINVDFNSREVIRQQLRIADEKENGGEALFAYATVFPNHSANHKMKTIQSHWQEQILQNLLQLNQNRP
ncbi:family 10 glycosylhydrolase [bacterium]|nr:family 10 glycosylhydrolase [bacterium]